MKHTQLLLRTTGMLAAALPAVAVDLEWGITTPVAPAPAGYLNDTLRAQNPYLAAWNFGVFSSTRYEVKQNGGFVGPGSGADFRTDTDNDNNYLLQKLILRGGYTGKWFEVMVQGRHSSATSDERSSSGNFTTIRATNSAGVVIPALPNGPAGGGSSPESDGPLDLHQAYVFLGNHKEFPVSLKLGRQEFILGEQRIVGPLAWNNVQRQWDAAKVRWQTPWFSADAWSSMVVMPDDNAFNKPNNKEIFSGLQLSTKEIPKTWTELYFLGRNVGRGANDGTRGTVPAPFRPPEAQDIYTVGALVKNSTNDWVNIDWSTQLYYQFGNFADVREATGPRRDHSAWAAIGAAGYTWKESSYMPRLGLEYSYASGDSNAADNRHGTFVHLYPTGHLFYGFADFASLQNLHNLRFRSSILATPRVRLMLEGHLKWLDSTDDNFYNVAGLPRGGITPQGAAALGTGYGINPGAGKFVGTEIDLVGTWQVNKYLSLEAAYCHFFRGDYIKDSLSRVGSQDADYVYVQAQVNF
jgi:hypothetical protein